MKLSKCVNGHYYDNSKDKSCPYCLKQNEVDVCSSNIEVKMMEEDKNIKEEKRALTEEEVLKFEPITGWLVCIGGPDKGKDYVIRSERNFIGHSSNMDIYIEGDNSVSKENHAIVSFNPKKRVFKVYPGDGRGLVYLNGDDIDLAKELKSYDIIELGNTRLLFIALCGEKFGWE